MPKMKVSKPIIEYIRGDGSTIAELVKRSGLSRRTLLKNLTTLEQQGFLERVYRLPHKETEAEERAKSRKPRYAPGQIVGDLRISEQIEVEPGVWAYDCHYGESSIKRVSEQDISKL